MMQIGLSLPLNLNVELKTKYIYDVELSNFNHVWIGDNAITIDVFTNVKLALNASKSLRVWTGVTSPFYYDIETLLELSHSFTNNFRQRFGLGLGIGKKELLPVEFQKKPFYYFKKKVLELITKYKVTYDTGHLDFPLAIGALEKNMIYFAYQIADILLLNSGSEKDIERANKLRNDLESRTRTSIFAYAMLDILTKDEDNISPIVWNIVKRIAANASIELLKAHSYSPKLIEKIKTLDIKVWDRKAPRGELRTIVEDFAFVGTLDKILEELEKIKNLNRTGDLQGIVLGWAYKPDKWAEIKSIRKFLL